MANLRVDNLTGTGGRNAIDGSILLESSSKSRISVTNTTGLDFGTDQFTIEFWIYLLGTAPTNKNIFARSTSNSGTTGMIMWFDSNGHLEWDSAHGASGAIHTGAGIGNHMWHHIAVSRDSSNNTRLYLNGVLKGTASSDTTDIVGATNLQIASNIAGDGYYNDAYISNFRMVKGTAVYSGTTDFTPPTEKLTAIDGTILLCCQDSDDPTQEATGKTITGYGTLGGDKTEGNLLTNTLDWNGAASSYSTDMPDGWTAGNGAQVLYDTGGTSGGATNRMLRLRNDGSSSYIYQTIPTVIGQKYTIDLWYEAQDSSLAVKWLAGTSANDATNGSELWNVGSDGTQAKRSGTFNASATTTYITFAIISGTNDASVYVDDIQVKAVNHKSPKVVPPVGVDEGVTFEGDIKMNSQGYMYFPTGDTSQRGRGRGTFSGGYTPSPSNTNLASIDYVQIQSLGNSIDFGDLTTGRYGGGSGASSTRGLQMGGRVSSTRVKTIDYITFATTSNATTFGDLTVINAYVHGASNNTRALNMGGGTPAVTDTIEYVTIASTGNGTDFGNLTDARGGAPAVASPTRACCMGGYDDSAWIDIIDYVTIATTGNATDFGDLSSAFGYGGGLSSNTRGIMGGGSRGSGEINDIVYITIASEGNAIDFGDLYAAREHTSATSNSIRGIWGGGVTPTYYNNIQYVTISTTGNANDFGDFIVDNSKAYSMTTSDSHGGLS